MELEGPPGAGYTIRVASADVDIERSGRFDPSGTATEALTLPEGEHTIVATVTEDGETSELVRQVVPVASVVPDSDDGSALPGFLTLGALGAGGYWWWRRRSARTATSPEA